MYLNINSVTDCLEIYPDEPRRGISGSLDNLKRVIGSLRLG